jgi:hypothetical protein
MMNRRPKRSASFLTYASFILTRSVRRYSGQFISISTGPIDQSVLSFSSAISAAAGWTVMYAAPPTTPWDKVSFSNSSRMRAV